MNRTCKSCGADWVVEPVEAEWSRSQGTALPRVCASCRADGRGLRDSTYACANCGTTVRWPKALALYSAMFGWTALTVCPAPCGGNLDAARALKGERRTVAAVWLRAVRKIDIDAPAVEELTPEQQLRAAKVPKLDELFKGLGSGMQAPTFGELAPRPARDEPRRPSEDLVASSREDLPREAVPSPDSLFAGLGKKRP